MVSCLGWFCIGCGFWWGFAGWVCGLVVLMVICVCWCVLERCIGITCCFGGCFLGWFVDGVGWFVGGVDDCYW